MKTPDRIAEDILAMSQEPATLTPARLAHLQQCERILALFVEGIINADQLKRAYEGVE